MINTAKMIPNTTPQNMVIRLFLMRIPSCLKAPIAKEIMGPIKGAKIIAPITTGPEFPKSPKVAIMVDKAMSTR